MAIIKSKYDFGDVQFWSVVLFKVGSLILALLLGLQLSAKTLNIPFDLTRVLTLEQFLFVYAISIVAFLGFVEGRTLQKRAKEVAVPSMLLYIIAIIGAYFTIGVIWIGDYNFNNSVTNSYIGYYLLFGTVLIFINGRKQIFKRLFSD